MATVYSTSFCEAHSSSGLTFEVPAGFRAVVRDADCFYAGGAGQSAQLQGPAGGIFAYFPFVAEINGVLVSWRGRQVFDAGDVVTFATTSPMDIKVSGYLLQLP
ncbi:MAG: hypothetical protein OK454_06105 [Thaumarchaeota archaeon]|nr:hypothetical protein [Nitrososphaerota archaeon]